MTSSGHDKKWEEFLARLPKKRRRRVRKSLFSNLARAVGLPPPLFWVQGHLIPVRAAVNFVSITFWSLVFFRGVLLSLDPAHPVHSLIFFTGSLTVLVTLYQLIQARRRIRREFVGVRTWKDFTSSSSFITSLCEKNRVSVRMRRARKWVMLAPALLLALSATAWLQNEARFREVSTECLKHPSEGICYEAAYLADERSDYLKTARSLQKLCDHQNAGACADLANLHLDHEDAKSARTPAEKSCDMKEAGGCYQLAGSLCMLGDTQQAEAALEKATALGYFRARKTRVLASIDPALHCLQNRDALVRAVASPSPGR